MVGGSRTKASEHCAQAHRWEQSALARRHYSLRLWLAHLTCLQTTHVHHWMSLPLSSLFSVRRLDPQFGHVGDRGFLNRMEELAIQ